MGNFTVQNGGVVASKKNLPSIDVRYGPYESVQAAHNALGAFRSIGLTVGIIDGDNIVEYWYQGGTAQNNLVPKQTGGGGGSVSSVNNVSPDTNGNVTLTPNNIGAAAASDVYDKNSVYTKSESNDTFATHAFSSITVGETSIEASSKDSGIQFIAGSNISFDTEGNAVTITAASITGNDGYTIETDPSLILFNTDFNNVITDYGSNNTKTITVYGRVGRGVKSVGNITNVTLPTGFTEVSHSNGELRFYATEGTTLSSSIYIAIAFTYNGLNFNVSVPMAPTKAGRDGEDADDIEWIYKYNEAGYNGSEGEVNPSGAADSNDVDNQQKGWVPNGWYNHALSISASNPTVYASWRVKDSVSGEWGTFQTPITWSHWGRNGQDGDGIEYVFVRTKDDVKPAVPTQSQSSTYCEENNNYNADDHLPYVRVTSSHDISGSTDAATFGGYKYTKCTDDPVGVDSTWKYEWAIIRKKASPDSAGVRAWNKYEGSMSVWNNWAEDGNGIASITKLYARASVGTSADDGTAPTGIDSSVGTDGWATGSPAVTDTYPYLWVKETTAYTNSTSVVKYYCIGRKGSNGVDAQDIEWVYIRTKTNTAPVILNDVTYTDSNNKTYTSDDHLPHVTGNANIENNQNTYECTDDPTGVTDVWKYEWEIKRTKGNVNNDGSRTWNYYSGAMTLHNNYAESAFIIDTDNDNDQFGTDSTSTVLINQTRYTTVYLYDGASQETLTELTAYLTYEDGRTTVPSTVATVETDYTTGIVSVTVLASATPITNTEIQAHITATCDKGSKDTLFTLYKVMGGAPGLTPVIYNVAATNKVFSFQRTDSNALTPSSRTSQINVARTEGSTTTILSTAQTGLTFSWGFDNSSTAQASGKAIGSSISITNTQASSYSSVWVELSTGDRETLAIVKDGAKGGQGNSGQNSVRIDIDNQADLVSLDSEGKVRFARNVVTHARIYDGANLATTGVSKHSSLTNENMKIGTSSTATVSSVSGGVVTITWSFVAGDTVVAATRTITLTYGGVDYSAVFTLGTTASDSIYQVMPNPSEVSFSYNASNVLSPSSTTLKCGYTKATGSGTISVAEATVSSAGEITEGGNGVGLYLSYRTKTNGTWGSTWTKYSTNGITVSSNTTVQDYEFAISSEAISNNTISDTKIVDREAVPVVKGGVNGTSPIFADLDNEMDSVACDYLGNTVGEQTVTTTVAMYKGSNIETLASSNVVCKIGGTTLSSSYSSSTSSVGYYYKVSKSISNGKCTLVITVREGAAIASNTEVIIEITKTIDGVSQSRTLTLTINGVRGGQNGEPAVLYNLKPSDSQISVGMTDAGAYTPSTYSLTCGYVKNVGGVMSEKADEPDQIDSTYYIYFRRRTRSNNSWEDTYYRYGNSSYKSYVTSLNVSTYNAVEFILCDATGNNFAVSSLANLTVIDKETVPVVADGRRGLPGENVVRLDIDNEMDMVRTDSTGKIEAARTISTVVHLYDGGTEVNISSATITVSGGPSSTVATFSQEGSVKGKQLNWAFIANEIMTSVYDITISYTYQDTVYSATFTILASLNQPIYQLKPSPSNLVFSRNASNQLTPSSKTVSLTIVKLDGSGTTSYTTASSAGVTVRYSTSSMPSAYNAGTSWTSGNITVANSASNLYIAMFNSTSHVLLDRETIPVIANGENGGAGQSAFMSTVFIRQNSTPGTPTGGSYASPIPTTTGWSDGIPSGTAKLWASTRIFTSDEQDPQQSAWTTPREMTDTADFDVCFSTLENPGIPPHTHPSQTGNWTDTASEDTIWMATAECHNGEWSAWQIMKVKGEGGENAIQLTLDNEHEDFLYSGSKNETCIAPANGAVITAHLWNGNTEIPVADVSWNIDLSGCTGFSTSELSNVDNRYTLTGISAKEAVLCIQATYNGKNYKAKFTANRVNQDKYDIILSPSSIAYNPATYPSGNGMSISVSATRTDLTGDTTSATLTTSGSVAAGQLRVYYAFVNSSGTKSSFTLAGSSVNVSAGNCRDYVGVYFELRLYSSSSAYNVRDYETVEIAKSENGQDAYVAVANPSLISIATDENDSVLDTNEKVVQVQFYKGESSTYTLGTISGASSGSSSVTIVDYGSSTGRRIKASGTLSTPVTVSITASAYSVTRTVNVLVIPNKKGSNGVDAIRLDLNNEHDSIMYAGSTKVGGNVTSQATLYAGGAPVSASSVGWRIYSTSGIPDNATGRSLSSGLITVKQLTALHGTVVIEATYPNTSSGNHYYATFSVDKVIDKPKYELKIDRDVVAVNTDDAGSRYYPVNVKVYKTEINSSGAVVTSLVTSLANENIILWSQNIENGSPTPAAQRTSYYDQYPGEGYTYQVDTIQYTGVIFTITTSAATASTINTCLLDQEGIPVATVQNGAQGPQGKIGRNIYYAGTMTEVGRTSFTVTDTQAPYVKVKDNADGTPVCYVFTGENGTYAFPDSEGGYSASGSGWELMTSEFKYLITNAVFSDFAKLGSGVFNGDYAFSQYGTENGSSSQNYQDFTPRVEGNVNGHSSSNPLVLFDFIAGSTSPSFTLENNSSNNTITFGIATNPSSFSNCQYTWSVGANTVSNVTTPYAVTSGTKYYMLVMVGYGSGTMMVAAQRTDFKPNICINWLTGEIYSQLGRFVNVTIEGVLNNLAQTITSGTAAKYGVISGSDFWINPLKVGSIIYYNMSTALRLPCAFYQNGNYLVTNNTMTLQELRQCVGKKLYIYGQNQSFNTIRCGQQMAGGSDYVQLLIVGNGSYSLKLTNATNVNDLVQKYAAGNTCDVGLVQPYQSDHGNALMFANTYESYYALQPNTAIKTCILECKMGTLNGYECIYWEVVSMMNMLS